MVLITVGALHNCRWSPLLSWRAPIKLKQNTVGPGLDDFDAISVFAIISIVFRHGRPFWKRNTATGYGPRGCLIPRGPFSFAGEARSFASEAHKRICLTLGIWSFGLIAGAFVSTIIGGRLPSDDRSVKYIHGRKSL